MSREEEHKPPVSLAKRTGKKTDLSAFLVVKIVIYPREEEKNKMDCE